jgi:hypothetical protein
MATQDDVLRAQARALIRVLHHYKFDPASGAAPAPLWQAVEAFGRSGGTAADLQAISRKYAGTAAAAFCCGVKLRAPNSALFLALAAFTGSSPAYRFLDPSRWPAPAFAFTDKKAAPDPAIQGEVLERLEAAFEVEIMPSANTDIGKLPAQNSDLSHKGSS